MELKLFTDLIDALGKVAGGLKTIANLPKAEREKYRQTMNETYRLIDTTLNMVIIRLGDILLPGHDNDFILEVTKLDNYGDWMQAEREFRLCQSLRATLRETETLRAKLVGSISAKDWDTLLDQMRSILRTEGEVAEFIGEKFGKLSDSVRNPAVAGFQLESVRQQVKAFRDALIKERQQLIRQEIDLHNIVI